MNKPLSLISCFSQVWSESYGETYEPSPKDFKFAKMYLDKRDGDFQADTIVSRAKIYLSKEGFYAENRHSFTAFINNIGTFVPEKKKALPTIRTGWWTCKNCKERMLEGYQASHKCEVKV